MLKRFFRGRGVANSLGSDVWEYIARKDSSVPNGERGLGVSGVDGVSSSLPPPNQVTIPPNGMGRESSAQGEIQHDIAVETEEETDAHHDEAKCSENVSLRNAIAQVSVKMNRYLVIVSELFQTIYT